MKYEENFILFYFQSCRGQQNISQKTADTTEKKEDGKLINF